MGYLSTYFSNSNLSLLSFYLSHIIQVAVQC